MEVGPGEGGVSQQQPPADKRTLVVRTCKLVKSGNTNGRDWSIFELGVATVAGEPIDAKFKSFRDCSTYIGKPTEYEVEVEVHEQYGTSYKLTPPKRNYGDELDELRTRVERLESQAGGQPAAAAAPGPAMPPGMPPGPPAGPPQQQSVPTW